MTSTAAINARQSIKDDHSQTLSTQRPDSKRQKGTSQAKRPAKTMIDIITGWFFLLQLPITLLVDLSPLYPDTNIIFSFPRGIRKFYLDTFNDPLLRRISMPGGWFKSFLLLEGIVQLPICLWVSLQYWRNKHQTFQTNMWMFAFSIQVMTTTFACIGELLSFDDSTVSLSQKANLVGFYVPYLLMPALMAYRSLRTIISLYVEAKEKADHLTKGVKRESPLIRRVLITGANSGIGFACIQRLIDENKIGMALGDVKLDLILTVRDAIKGKSVRKRLEKETDRFTETLVLKFVYIDLTSMQSIEEACKLILSDKHLSFEALILNAGMAQFSKLDLWAAIKQTLTSPIAAITTPNYKVQKIGATSEDGLAVTFQANFFGHYYMVGKLSPRLRPHGSIIWMSSLEATEDAFKYEDPQALRHRYGYESSKRLIDIMWSESQHDTDSRPVKQFCVHPGFCSTNIVSEVVSSLLTPVWIGVFYVARFCGSKFHTATAYNGAYAAAKIAMYPEEYDPSTKWGSAGNWDGEVFVAETPFDPIDLDGLEARQLVEEMTSLRETWSEKLSNSA